MLIQKFKTVRKEHFWSKTVVEKSVSVLLSAQIGKEKTPKTTLTKTPTMKTAMTKKS